VTVTIAAVDHAVKIKVQYDFVNNYIFISLLKIYQFLQNPFLYNFLKTQPPKQIKQNTLKVVYDIFLLELL